MGTTLNLSSAYHPQTDGQTERLNQCLENYLRCMVSDCPRQWSKWLSLAEFWYNTNYHSSLQTTPFQALYGYPPPHLSLDSYFDSTSGDANSLLADRQHFMQKLRANLTQAQARMKFFADRKREDREFQVGDMVYLKLQPFRQNFVSLRNNLKLSSRFYSPYKILEKIGKVAYKLDLPDSSRIHPVFHVSLLKKYLGKSIVPVSELPLTDVNGLFLVQPCSIMDSRQISRRGMSVPQILIQWVPASSAFTSWEDLSFIRRKFPSFNPCGQGFVHRGGIVMDRQQGTVGGDAEVRGEKLGFRSKGNEDGGKERSSGVGGINLNGTRVENLED